MHSGSELSFFKLAEKPVMNLTRRQSALGHGFGHVGIGGEIRLLVDAAALDQAVQVVLADGRGRPRRARAR